MTVTRRFKIQENTRHLSPILWGAFLFSLVACMGCLRGESKSISEVLQIARTRYSDAQSLGLDRSVVSTLEKTTGELNEMLDKKQGRATRAAQVADLLNALSPRANYTTRPALIEIIKAYRSIAENGAPNDVAVELLVARTYSLLASELETGEFRL